MAITTLQPSAPAAVPRGYPRPAPGALETGATVIFDHARKMAARGIAATNDFMGNVEKTFGTPGPEIGPTPFKPGTVSPGAVIAKLGTAIFAAARTRANALQRQKIQDAQMAYQRAQVEGLKSAAADREARTGIAQKTYDLAAQQYLNPNAPQAPMMTTTQGRNGVPAGTRMPVPEYQGIVTTGNAATMADSRKDTPEIGSIKAALSAHQTAIEKAKVSIVTAADKQTMNMAYILKNPSIAAPGSVRTALNQFGLPPTFRYNPSDAASVTRLNDAAARYNKAFRSNHYNATVAEHQPDIDRLTLRLNSMSGDSGGMPQMPESSPAEPTAPAGPPPLQLPNMED
jgi:hypothetical protein